MSLLYATLRLSYNKFFFARYWILLGTIVDNKFANLWIQKSHNRFSTMRFFWLKCLRFNDSLLITRKVFKLRLKGLRLGHTDVMHPVLTSVYCPFNLLRLFKEGAHRSKTEFIILSDTHALHVRV